MIPTPVPRPETVAIPAAPRPPRTSPPTGPDFAEQLARSRRDDAHHPEPESPPGHSEAAKVSQRDDRARTGKPAARRGDAPDPADGDDAPTPDTASNVDRNVPLEQERIEPEGEIAEVADHAAGTTERPEANADRSNVAQSAHDPRRLERTTAPRGTSVAHRERAASKRPPTGVRSDAVSATSGDTPTAARAEDRGDGEDALDRSGARAARTQVHSTEPEVAAQPPDVATPTPHGASTASLQRNPREAVVRPPRRAGSKVDEVRAVPKPTPSIEAASTTAVRDIVVDLARPSDAPTARTALGRDGAIAQTFVRRLAGDVGAGVVRQANVLLSGNDRAEIRLIIRPPELGRVRIQLSVEGDHIAGRILVDNGTVRQAIEQHVVQLQRSFAEAGLELGEFEVSGGGPDRHSGNSGEDAATESDTSARTAAAATGFESAAALVVDHGQTHVNLVA